MYKPVRIYWEVEVSRDFKLCNQLINVLAEILYKDLLGIRTPLRANYKCFDDLLFLEVGCVKYLTHQIVENVSQTYLHAPIASSSRYRIVPRCLSGRFQSTSPGT